MIYSFSKYCASLAGLHTNPCFPVLHHRGGEKWGVQASEMPPHGSGAPRLCSCFLGRCVSCSMPASLKGVEICSTASHSLQGWGTWVSVISVDIFWRSHRSDAQFNRVTLDAVLIVDCRGARAGIERLVGSFCTGQGKR